MRFAGWLLVLVAIGWGGCRVSFPQNDKKEPSVKQAEPEQLRQRILELEKQVDDLEHRLQHAGGVDSAILSQVVSVNRIELGPHSRVKYADANEVPESLILYVLAKDAVGDTIKTAGTLSVKVVELDTKTNEVHTQQWQLTANDLLKAWLSGWGTNYFKVTLPWQGDWRPTQSTLPVTAQFVETLTGRTFETQMLVPAKRQ